MIVQYVRNIECEAYDRIYFRWRGYSILFLDDFLKLADFLGNASFPRDCRNARIKQKSTTIWINSLGSFRVL